MAEMVTAYKVVDKIVTTREPTYTLTLNKDEAQALRAVVGFVSGSAFNTPRKHTDAVWSALGGVGADDKWSLSGTLRFIESPGF